MALGPEIIDVYFSGVLSMAISIGDVGDRLQFPEFFTGCVGSLNI